MSEPIEDNAVQDDGFFPSPGAIASEAESEPEAAGSTEPDADGTEGVETSTENELWPDGHPADNLAAESEAIAARERGEEPPKKAKQDQSRFEYWQSEATKFKNQAEANAQLAQLGAKVASNPALLAQLAASPTFAATVADPVVETPEAEQKLVVPVAPVKPKDFNDTDAYGDPQSESFKFRAAKETYQGDMIEYYGKKEELREKREVAQRKDQERRANEKRQLAAVQSQMQTKYGLTAQEAVLFVQKMTKPESVSMDNLVALFKMKFRGAPVKTGQRRSELLDRANRGAAPLPAAVAGGEGSEDGTPETKFNLGLLKYSHKNRK